MIRVYWCFALSALMLIMCSFSCSKESESMKTEEVPNVTIDFTQFPSRTIWTLYGDNGQGIFKFDSDSAKLFNVVIPDGTYEVTWKLMNITPSLGHKAKMLNTHQGMVVPWDNALITSGSRYIRGTYTFTKEKK